MCTVGGEEGEVVRLAVRPAVLLKEVATAQLRLTLGAHKVLRVPHLPQSRHHLHKQESRSAKERYLKKKENVTAEVEGCARSPVLKLAFGMPNSFLWRMFELPVGSGLTGGVPACCPTNLQTMAAMEQWAAVGPRAAAGL